MKKLKGVLYVTGILWVAVITQVLVNKAFMGEERVIEAFADTEDDLMEGKLNLVVDYGDRFLSEEDKKQLITYFAGVIGLEKPYTIKTTKNQNTNTVLAEKEGKYAHTWLEVTTVKEETGIRQYIIIKLSINEKINSILKFKDKLEKAVKKLERKDYQTLLKFTKTIDGKMTKKERDKEVEGLLEKLQGKVVSENKEEDLYTVYAFTGLVKEYLKVENQMINLNIAVSYDESKDKTNIYLATPILNEDY